MTNARLIPALLLCLYGCATTAPHPPTASTKPARWTVMVYMNAKNDLEHFSVENYDQMKKVGSTDEVNILVDYGRPDHRYDRRYGAWSSTVRFRVEKGVDPLLANGNNMGKVDMGSARELKDFVDWSMKQYPAEHYALII